MDALPEFALLRATTLDEVVKARASHPESRLLGGGTDLIVNIRRGIVAPPVLIDVNHVEELRTVRADARTLEIGAAVKLAELAAHEEVMRHYPVVAQAAGFIADPRIGIWERSAAICASTRAASTTTRANGGAAPTIIVSRPR